MISIVHLLLYAMMYLTRVAGMSLRLPCKAVRNRKTLRQFVGAGHAPPATYRKTQPDGQPIGRAMLARFLWFRQHPPIGQQQQMYR